MNCNPADIHKRSLQFSSSLWLSKPSTVEKPIRQHNRRTSFKVITRHRCYTNICRIPILSRCWKTTRNIFNTNFNDNFQKYQNKIIRRRRNSSTQFEAGSWNSTKFHKITRSMSQISNRSRNIFTLHWCGSSCGETFIEISTFYGSDWWNAIRLCLILFRRLNRRFNQLEKNFITFV